MKTPVAIVAILLVGALFGGSSFASEKEGRVVDIAVGGGRKCALLDSGDVWCWGRQIQGDKFVEREVPFLLQGLSNIRNIFAGDLTSCAIDSVGAAFCWGWNYQESIQRNEAVFSPKPFSIEGLPSVKHISIGYRHLCALAINGDVYCWGQNPVGEIGDGTNRNRARPYKVEGIEKAVALNTGINNTCAVEARGSVKCWGGDDPGNVQRGEGYVINTKVPKKIHGIEDLTSVANGRNYFCGVRRNGQLFCWGSIVALPKTEGGFGQLPLRRKGSVGTATIASENKIVATDIEVFTGCVVYENGRMACWDFENKTPETVTGLDGIKKLSFGGDGGCVLLRDARVRCWDGKNYTGHKEVSLPPNSENLATRQGSRASVIGAPPSTRDLRPLAEQGDAEAQYNLGIMYRRGQGEPQDNTEAAKWFRLAAEQGHAGAQYSLGRLYSMFGVTGAPANFADAVKWYRLAAEQGHAGAQSGIGFMYRYGQGVPQDHAEAVKWFRLAAEQGQAFSQYRLGSAYEKGQGVPQDYVEAYKWTILAAAQGDKAAERRRDIIAAKLSPGQIAEAERKDSEWLEAHPR